MSAYREIIQTSCSAALPRAYSSLPRTATVYEGDPRSGCMRYARGAYAAARLALSVLRNNIPATVRLYDRTHANSLTGASSVVLAAGTRHKTTFEDINQFLMNRSWSAAWIKSEVMYGIGASELHSLFYLQPENDPSVLPYCTRRRRQNIHSIQSFAGFYRQQALYPIYSRCLHTQPCMDFACKLMVTQLSRLRVTWTELALGEGCRLWLSRSELNRSAPSVHILWRSAGKFPINIGDIAVIANERMRVVDDQALGQDTRFPLLFQRDLITRSNIITGLNPLVW